MSKQAMSARAMQVRELLESKGYDVQMQDLGMEWLCVLEWHNQIKNFFSVTEEGAIQQAARYVAELEAGYEAQRSRMRCEGCGE